MRVLISMKAIRGSAELDALADLVAGVVSQAGHQTLVATREIARLGLTVPAEFMPYVRGEIKTCHLLLVLYHPELRGGLIELGMAYTENIPIWLCSRAGEYVSSSARGCADLQIKYNTMAELADKLAVHLETLTPTTS